MKDTNSNGHRLLIQKLLVSIHYLTLFRDEIVLVEKTPSLLGASFSPNIVQSELGEILAAVDALSKQKKLIKSTFWYDEASFRLMNHSLDIVGTWIRGIDNVLEICESKSVFHAILGDNRQRVFGVLIDVFTSLRVTNLAIKEESDYPVLLDPVHLFKERVKEMKKAELLAKIDAMVPKEERLTEEIPVIRPTELLEANSDDVIKKIRHYLFDNKGLVYVVDAQEDLKDEIASYNVFDRFQGAYDSISDALVIVENVLEQLEVRGEEKVDEAGHVVSQTIVPLYLLIYGQNKLVKDSRFESLLEELSSYAGRSDLHLLYYRAY
ncbi:hypothetical protein [Streptococcus alactolyticus]|uniref:hypothetical protein n=1 Tax=Streptococcus alactolyticus TaxID=29389 RepID=UPI003F97BC9B